MKQTLKSSGKVAITYLSAVFLFSFFMIGPLSMENNQYLWLTILSFILFLFLWSFMTQQMRKIGFNEKNPAANIPSYALKGFVYGLIGFSPFILIEVLYFLIYQPGTIAMQSFHVLFRSLFGPMYFLIRGLGYTWYAYLIATISVPIMSLVGYLIGYYDVSVRNLLTKKNNEDFLDG